MITSLHNNQGSRCLAKSTLIGWREYYGGGRVGVDRHLCGAQQTRGLDPMLLHYWPHRQRRWTNIETTSGQVFAFAGRAVRILIHACSLVGTGCTVLCVANGLSLCFIYLLSNCKFHSNFLNCILFQAQTHRFKNITVWSSVVYYQLR